MLARILVGRRAFGGARERGTERLGELGAIARAVDADEQGQPGGADGVAITVSAPFSVPLLSVALLL